MSKPTPITGKNILAMTDRQILKINRNTNRKQHPTPAPKTFLPDDTWGMKTEPQNKYAEYYAQFLLGNRVRIGQASKRGLSAKQATQVREHVRTRLFDSLNVTSVTPLNNDDVDKLIETKLQSWDVFAA